MKKMKRCFTRCKIPMRLDTQICSRHIESYVRCLHYASTVIHICAIMVCSQVMVINKYCLTANT